MEDDSDAIGATDVGGGVTLSTGTVAGDDADDRPEGAPPGFSIALAYRVIARSPLSV